MADRSRSELQGPVHTVETEDIEWDASREQWKPWRGHSVQRFRRDGKLEETEYHNPDGSIARTTYVYDPAGRLTQTQFKTDAGPPTSIVYEYDDSGRRVRTVQVPRTAAVKSRNVAPTIAPAEKPRCALSRLDRRPKKAEPSATPWTTTKDPLALRARPPRHWSTTNMSTSSNRCFTTSSIACSVA